MNEKLLKVINQILTDSGRKEISSISHNTKLREDLNFDSLALATLTVVIEDEFNKDIFENGNVQTIGQIIEILEK